MGCTLSKLSSNRDGPLSRSMSAPIHSVAVEGEELDERPWRSTPHIMFKFNRTGNHLSEVVDGSAKQCGQIQFSKLRPVKEEESGLHHENTGQSMQRVEDALRAPEAGSCEASKRRSFERSVTVHPIISEGLNSKCSEGNDFGRETPSFVNTPTANLPCSHLTRFRSFSCKHSVDTGLKLLLSPVVTPSQTVTSLTRSLTFNNGRFNLGLDDNHRSGIARTPDAAGGFSVGDNERSGPDWMENEEHVAEPGSPLFDPSILATFEKALEALSDDSWQGSEASISSPENVSSSEGCSDADSPQLPRASGVRSKILSTGAFREEKLYKVAGNTSQRRTDASYNKKFSFSKVSPFDKDDKEWTTQDYLEGFEMKCPPGGEEKIVLYFTSLRGIRKTFEDCCTMRSILKGFRIHVDERDVWMHSKFRQELTTVMGSALSVPRLFIKGRYIGGAEEVKQLHEDGILEKLVEGLPSECRKICNVCADVRFIPCTTCSGSCKTISQDYKKARCPDCNENGLIMCPLCGS